ncbi:MAG: InlB B-repeat-containing protein [Clostridia bacterium]|nr:InlB B-repeat-containing protein [Clostridia bacterium]
MKNTRKTRLFSLLLCCLMLVGLLPMGQVVHASYGYSLWVGSVEVDSSNKDDIPGVIGGKASYDPVTRTLTLDGVTGFKGFHYKNGAAYVIFSRYQHLTITGSMDLQQTPDELVSQQCGIYSEYNCLTIKDADLNINARSNAIVSEETIKIINSKVSVRSQIGSAIMINDASVGRNGVEFIGSTVEAKGLYAINAQGDYITITGSTVDTETICSYNGSIRVNSGSLKVTSSKDAGAAIIHPGEVSWADTHELIGSITGTQFIIREKNSHVFDLYDVSFDANGHGAAPETQSVEIGKTAVRPEDPEESGWRFDGWYREAECINAFDFSTPINSDITLYAKWTGILSGTVRIAGGAKHYGDLLELEYTGDIASVPFSKLRFEWQESDNKTSWTNIIGETGATYQTPATGDTLTYVRVRVTADGYDGAVYSDVRAIVPPHVVDTLKGTVTIVQDHASEAYFVLGMPVTATAKNNMGFEMTMDGLMYRWQRRANYDGAPWEYIPGATGKIYTPVGADENCFIRAEVSYTQLLGELYSSSKWVDWADESYTVAFDANGHGTAPDQQTVHRGSHATKPDDPIADGWTFGGWYTEAACINAFDFEKSVMRNITLYADWAEEEVFVMTGAYVSAEVKKNAGNYIFDDEMAAFTWKDGNSPAASAVDYHSSHIYKDVDLTDKLHEDPVPYGVYYAEYFIENSVRYDRSIDFSSLTAANCDFTIPGYTVTCESIEASIDSMGYSRARLLLKLFREPDFAFTTQPVSGAAKKTEPYDFFWTTNVAPEGIYVLVWVDNRWVLAPALLSEDGTSAGISYEDVSYAAIENVTRHAVVARTHSNHYYSDEFTVEWTDETAYTVTFDANGHGTAPAAQTVEHGKTATKPADPTETGWVFGGWYKEKECTNAFDFATPITGNITLYAKWTVAAYTVTFDANGHGTAPAAQTVEHGKTATMPADPTASGWTFKGWYKEVACTNAFDFATPITADITLYAKWTEEGTTPVPTYYTVTFDANGHGIAPAVQTVESGKTATMPADPTETGWLFGGWYKEAACTNAYDFSTAVTGDITLYAKWVKDSGGSPGSPMTGDNSHLSLWLALSVVSAGGVIGLTVNSRKRRKKAE